MTNNPFGPLGAGMTADSAGELALNLAEDGADWLERFAVPLLHTEVGQARLYRLPFALAAVGRAELAKLTLDVLRRLVLTATGDVAPGPLRDRFSARWASYPMTILAAGAQTVGEGVLARAIMGTVAESLVDPDRGGLLGERREVRRTRRQDLFPTAQYGITGLLMGETGAVATTRRWILEWWRGQPHPTQAVYLSTDGDALITQDAPDRQGEAGSVLDFGEPGQPLASLGIGAAFLAALGEHDDEEALAAAEEILALYDRTPAWALDHQVSVQLCKRAWGAARLVTATQQPRYERAVIEMVDWFARGVSTDGSWRAPAHLTGSADGEGQAAAHAEITAEFVQHLMTSAGALQVPIEGSRNG